MRVQLMLQRLELRFDEPRLELRLTRALLSLAVVEHRVNQADDARARHGSQSMNPSVESEHTLKLADPVVAVTASGRSIASAPEDHDLPPSGRQVQTAALTIASACTGTAIRGDRSILSRRQSSVRESQDGPAVPERRLREGQRPDGRRRSRTLIGQHRRKHRRERRRPTIISNATGNLH